MMGGGEMEQLLGTGAAMGATPTGAGRFVAGFFQPMIEDRLGMCFGPTVGQHLFQAQVIRM